MSERALATVETVRSVRAIDGADAIECAQVRGWDVVIKKGELVVGERCLYIEVDAMLDVTDERFGFLAHRGVRTDAEGHRGHVLKTARLRGQISQGLALPLGAFPEVADATIGADVADTLGIRKWDAPIPASLAGLARGTRPSWIPKSDEERIQNLEWMLALTDHAWVATEKIDGTSCTIYVDPIEGTHGVCTRNLDLVESDTNTLWAIARDLDLHAKLGEIGGRCALQGEVFGEGIQGNPLQIKGTRLAAFSFIRDGVRVAVGSWPQQLADVPRAPTIEGLSYPTSIAEALAQADGRASTISGRPAEGIVWVATDASHLRAPDGGAERPSWKVISNRYLLKNDR